MGPYEGPSSLLYGDLSAKPALARRLPRYGPGEYCRSVNRAEAKRLAALLDPLAPADPELYVERPAPPINTLREAWAFGPEEGGHCLLVGGVGSGKSTELTRLATLVAEATDPPLVTLLRLQEQLDPGQVTAAQVLFLLGVASLALVDEKPPNKTTQALQKAYADIVEPDGKPNIDVAGLLSRIAVLVGGVAKAGGQPLAGALIGGVGGLAKGVRAPRLPLPGRGLRLSANQTPVINLAEAVADAMEWTRTRFMRAPMTFFVDGLDKLDPGSIDELFGSGVLSLPPCPVVYSAPLALRYTVKGIPLDPLYTFLTVHNFPVFREDAHDRRNPAGFAAMREIVAKRLEHAQLEANAVFTDGLADGGVVDRAIEASGGVAQIFLDLLDRALRRAVVQAEANTLIIDEATLQTVIEEARKRMALRVKPSQFDILRQVRATQARPEGESADDLLYHNVVLAYPNDPAWFRPSPLLDRYLEEGES